MRLIMSDGKIRYESEPDCGVGGRTFQLEPETCQSIQQGRGLSRHSPLLRTTLFLSRSRVEGASCALQDVGWHLWSLPTTCQLHPPAVMTTRHASRFSQMPPCPEEQDRPLPLRPLQASGRDGKQEARGGPLTSGFMLLLTECWVSMGHPFQSQPGPAPNASPGPQAPAFPTQETPSWS